MRYIFIDMDNTIAENTTPDDIEFYENLYSSKRPVNIVIKAIKKLYKDDYWIILTNTQGDYVGIEEKLHWLSKYFPKYKEAHFLPINGSKVNFILNYCEENKIAIENCVIIDDKKHILQKCKAAGINTKYPLQIICDYEEAIDK